MGQGEHLEVGIPAEKKRILRGGGILHPLVEGNHMRLDPVDLKIIKMCDHPLASDLESAGRMNSVCRITLCKVHSTVDGPQTLISPFLPGR